MIQATSHVANLAHIAIFTRSNITSIAFYEKILGFAVDYRYGDDTVFLRNGTAVLELIEDGQDHHGEYDEEKRHIAFACTEIEEIHKLLLENNVRVEKPGIVHLTDFGNRGCKYILFRGPDGERLEVQEIF